MKIEHEGINLKKIAGILLMVIGIVLLIGFGKGITGNVIGFEDSSLNYVGMLFGVVLIVGGILIGMSKHSTEQSELEIKLVDISGGKDKNHYRAYVMHDSQGAFGDEETPVTLGQVKKEIDRLSRDDPDYVGYVRAVYVPALKEKFLRGNGEERKIAGEFLEVFNERIEGNETKDKYRLDKSKRESIKLAFKDWNGAPNSAQKRILKEYDLTYHPISGGRKHPRISNAEGVNITLSGSPSDENAGGHIGRDIIALLEHRKGYRSS